MSNRKTLNERIEAAKAEVAQKEARVKQLLQQQKAQERKDRTHRLCLRGGKLEKLFPELSRLTEDQFETFVEKCLLTKYTKGVLAELAPPEQEQSEGNNDTSQGNDNTAVRSTETAAHIESVSVSKAVPAELEPAQKTQVTTQSSSANNNNRTAQTAAQHNNAGNSKPAQAARVAG